MTDPLGVETLRAVLERARTVLLDFDGPVCQIFAGLTDQQAAQRLRPIIRQAVGHVDDLSQDLGPHELLEYAGRQSAELAHQVDAVLRAAEVEAAHSAVPTPGATDFLMACHETGRPVAIVSNNAGEAVKKYLVQHNLSGLVTCVVGRDLDQPERMKPDPYIVQRALDALAAEPDSTVLVGDSVTDVIAGHAAGTLVIGYANKPGKSSDLAAVRADAISQSMADLAQETARKRQNVQD